MIEPRKGPGGRITPALTGFSPLIAAIVVLAGCSAESTCPGGSYMQGDQCVLVAQDAIFSTIEVNVEDDLMDASTENNDAGAIEATDTNELDNSESEQETNTTFETNQRENDADPEDSSIPPDGTEANDETSANTDDGRARSSNDEGSQSG